MATTSSNADVTIAFIVPDSSLDSAALDASVTEPLTELSSHQDLFWSQARSTLPTCCWHCDPLPGVPLGAGPGVRSWAAAPTAFYSTVLWPITTRPLLAAPGRNICRTCCRNLPCPSHRGQAPPIPPHPEESLASTWQQAGRSAGRQPAADSPMGRILPLTSLEWLPVVFGIGALGSLEPWRPDAALSTHGHRVPRSGQ